MYQSGWEELQHLYLTRSRFELRAVSDVLLPAYKGSTFRGVFGHAFKRMVCSTHRYDCADCLLKSACLYSYIFETPPPDGGKMMRLYNKVPHPYVIEPPSSRRKKLRAGDLFSFHLVLVGKACEYFPYFVYAFSEIGKSGIGAGNGKYVLERVLDAGLGTDERLLFDGSSGKIDGGPCSFRPAEVRQPVPKEHPIKLTFVTPTRLVSGGRLASKPDFHLIVRTLLRRVSSQSYFHCGHHLQLDFRDIVQQAENVCTVASEVRWVDWERYSGRQKTRMKLGGFVGEVAYEKRATAFLPLLRVGEWMHVGKCTTFGLGKYKVIGSDINSG